MKECSCGKEAEIECPVLGDEICFLCCSNKRNSVIDCSNNCQYNPFSFLSEEEEVKNIEVQTLLKMHDLLHRLDSSYNLRFAEELSRINRGYEFSNAEISYLIYRKFFIENSIDNESVYVFLKKYKFRGFSNDEIVVIESHKASKPTLFEFKNKINQNFFEAVDLLSHEKQVHRIFDSSIACSSMQSGALILAWPLEFKGYTRLGQFAMEFESFIIDEFLDELNALSISYSESEQYGVKDYLMEHLAETAELGNDIKDEIIDEIIDPFDSEGGYFVQYSIKEDDLNEILFLFEGKADFREHNLSEDEDGICFEWLSEGDSKTVSAELTLHLSKRSNFSQNAISSLGFILIFENKLIFSSHSRLLVKYAENMLMLNLGQFLEKI